ncbi:hypothetical protein ABZ897_60625 [Nonomuraea sp. NPDC046802]|uniref:hypothetical protein n=1 Tax=Nonomuraea sp. NPDC046802 TaxID=3154919 RepID=UPI0033D79903
MSAVDVAVLLLGIAVAVIIGLLTGILTWWRDPSLPAALLSGGAAFGATLGLWFMAVHYVRSG